MNATRKPLSWLANFRFRPGSDRICCERAARPPAALAAAFWAYKERRAARESLVICEALEVSALALVSGPFAQPGTRVEVAAVARASRIVFSVMAC